MLLLFAKFALETDLSGDLTFLLFNYRLFDLLLASIIKIN